MVGYRWGYLPANNPSEKTADSPSSLVNSQLRSLALCRFRSQIPSPCVWRRPCAKSFTSPVPRTQPSRLRTNIAKLLGDWHAWGCNIRIPADLHCSRHFLRLEVLYPFQALTDKHSPEWHSLMQELVMVIILTLLWPWLIIKNYHPPWPPLLTIIAQLIHHSGDSCFLHILNVQSAPLCCEVAENRWIANSKSTSCTRWWTSNCNWSLSQTWTVETLQATVQETLQETFTIDGYTLYKNRVSKVDFPIT